MSLELGDIIDDKYRIVRLIGEGGMGAVYEGENTRIHRRVAIKVLHSAIATSNDAVQRFEREAQAAGRIGSEHIVEVLDLGDLPSGDRYMVMEFLEGESLSHRITSVGRLSPQKTAAIVIDTLTGLKAAHEAGIIHRDLKPDNIFLLKAKGGKKDFVKIVDFGISKFSVTGGEFSMTRTGAVMGTPFYLSPEQARGERNLDHRADLYAVGVILYEAATGKVPFDGETFNELLFKIVLEPIPPLSTAVPDIDPHFAAIVEKSMARDVNQRFQSTDEMIQALQNWLAGQPLAPELAVQAAAARQGMDLGATALQSAGAPTKMRTHGAWANTNAEETQKGGSKKALLAAAVLLLAGGGAFFAYDSNKTREAAAVQAQAELAQKESERERDQELARLEAEKAKAEAERALADQARQEAERDTAKVKLSTADEQRRREEEQKAAAEEARKAAAATAAANRRRANAPAGRTPAKPSATAKSGGRTIRTDL
jgi:tRNA A-37 threonylcarbamoyl transferase component Bud32